MYALVIALGLALDVAAAPTCISRFDQMACGYQCTANLTQLACAQTADGLCAKTPSRVVCWDPPPDVRQLLRARPELPRPRCISGIGRVACGFHCVQAFGKVACADTPLGACADRFGDVRCWDPAPEVRAAMESAGELTPASCETTLAATACGYHCEMAGQTVRCAATPWGTCERHFDQLACWDPAPELQAASTADPR
jgi:hypothetical protein